MFDGGNTLMTLDSILVCATSEYELKRLLREGGEVWQHVGQRGEGKLRWQHTLVKLPIAVALRLGLVASGPKMKAEPVEPIAETAVVPVPKPAVKTAPRLSKRALAS
jgi:hypothetical protein